jgi:hypothetical protein
MEHELSNLLINKDNMGRKRNFANFANFALYVLQNGNPDVILSKAVKTNSIKNLKKTNFHTKLF